MARGRASQRASERERYRPCLSRVGAIRRKDNFGIRITYFIQKGDPSDPSISHRDRDSIGSPPSIPSRRRTVVHPRLPLASLSLQCQCSCPRASGAIRYPLCTRVPQLGGSFLLDVVKRQYKTGREGDAEGADEHRWREISFWEPQEPRAKAPALLAPARCCYRLSSLNLKWDNGQRVVHSTRRRRRSERGGKLHTALPPLSRGRVKPFLLYASASSVLLTYRQPFIGI